MFGLTPFNRSGLERKSEDMGSFFDMMDDFFKERMGSISTLKYDTFKVDVKEDDEKVEVEAEMPGIKKEEIDISYKDDMLTVCVAREEEKKEEKENYIHRERTSSSMSRSMYLKNVDSDAVKAKLSDGVLKIILPKKGEAAPKHQINVE